MLLSCRHCSHFIPEEGKHLVYLVYSQSLLSLFQLAHKAKPHSRLSCQIYLRKSEPLAHFLNKQ